MVDRIGVGGQSIRRVIGNQRGESPNTRRAFA